MIEQPDSFTDLLDDEIAQALYDGIAANLFDDWNEANLNEGMLYADFRMAQMSDSDVIIDAFHEHWGIGPNDEYWLGA